MAFPGRRLRRQPQAASGMDHSGEPLIDAVSGSYPAAPAAPWFTWRRATLAFAVCLVIALAVAFRERSSYSGQAAEFSRSLIGDENTARLESYYFRIEDRFDRTKYRLFGGDTNPFDDGAVRVQFVARPDAPVYVFQANLASDSGYHQYLPVGLPGPAPLSLPAVVQLSANPEDGEGIWTTSGLPRSSPADLLMAKTFVRPDPARPYATVGILLIDARRVRLHVIGGTDDPGGDRGVHGPGRVAEGDLANLLAAWNGGFQGSHGLYGTYADGQTYRPLRDGYASLVVYQDGRLAMGTWGTDVSWSDDIEAVRQNAVLLVDNGEISPRTGEGNDTWGYVHVDSTEFITWRTAVGLTRDGNIIVAAGPSLSAETLAKALQAAGAWRAMQLDINRPWVLAGLYFQDPGGAITHERFMPGMVDSPARYLGTNERDFMYVTFDESRYR
ncbi:MAG: phosphodiester glycosidase family protein [Dehalococcoidia bacterium]